MRNVEKFIQIISARALCSSMDFEGLMWFSVGSDLCLLGEPAEQSYSVQDHIIELFKEYSNGK